MPLPVRQSIIKIDLQSPEFKRAPDATWRALLDQGPVVTTRQPLLGRIALATAYAEAQSVLRDPDLFSVDARRCGHRQAAGMRWWVPGIFRPLANNLLTLDGDQHRALRKRVDFAFKRSQLQDMQPQLERIVDEALHALHAQIVQDGCADFTEHVARPVPQRAISHLLGLEAAFGSRNSPFNRALTALGSVQSAAGLFRVVPAIRIISQTLIREIRSRREEPRDDLLSRLSDTTGDGRPLTDDELLAMVFLLYVAGHETTTHLMSTSLFSIQSEPYIREQISAPLADRDIHEFMRFNSPVQLSKPRFVLEDTEFAGIQLRKGETIAALLGSANRDHREFSDPDRLVLTQASPRHLGFGAGIHTCFGMHLALRETSMVLNRLLFDQPVAPAGMNDHCLWNRRLGLRSLQRLVVTSGR